jgi:hypothetical protein
MDNTCQELNWIHRERKFTPSLLHKTCGSLANLCHVATALENHNEIDLYMELKLKNQKKS